MAGTKRSGRKPSVNDVAEKLLTALKFLSIGQKSSGNEQAQHTYFTGGWGYAFNGVIACGIPIEGLDFEAYPNSSLLIGALNRVGKDLEITIDPLMGVHVVSGDMDVWVPTGNAATAANPLQDAQLGPLDDRFTQALDICARIVSDTAQNLRDAVIYSKPAPDNPAYSYALVSTNGVVLIEANTVQPIPAGFLFPKALSQALNKSGAKPTGFGVGAETFTVYLDNGGYIRAQRYATETYPPSVIQIMAELMVAPSMIEPPKGMFEAIDTVAPFSDNGTVFFMGGQVGAMPDDEHENWGASIAVKGLPDGVALPGDGLSLFSEDAKTIWLGDDKDHRPRAVIKGDLYTAVVAGKHIDAANGMPPVPQVVKNPTSDAWAAATGQTQLPPAFASAPMGWGGDEDNIPF